jgi:hypothetical protein
MHKEKDRERERAPSPSDLRTSLDDADLESFGEQLAQSGQSSARQPSVRYESARCVERQTLTKHPLQ